MRTSYLLSFFLLLILLATGSHLFSQEECLASIAGGEWSDEGTDIVTDKQGNTYVAGNTKSGSCYFPSKTIYSIGTNDMFIVKYNPDGTEGWIMQLGGDNYYIFDYEFFEYIGGMTLDTINDRLLVCGRFFGQLYLPDTSLYSLGFTLFVLSIDLDGNVQWVKTAAGGEFTDILPFGIAYDEEGCVYISGSDYNPVHFDSVTVPAGGFLAKYDLNGNLLWAKKKFRYYSIYPTPTDPYTEAAPYNLLYANGHLLVNGQTINSIIVIDTITIYTASNYGASYVASFSEDGNIEWITLFGGPHSQNGLQFTVNDSSEIFATGTYQGTCVFGNDTLFSQPANCFLSKLSPTGDMLWTRSLNSSNWSCGNGLVCDQFGYIYISGEFYGIAQFGCDTISTSGFRYPEMFLIRFSDEGMCSGVRHYPAGDIQGLTMDYTGNICMTGYFYDSLPIGGNTFYSHGVSDFFVANCSPITSTKDTPAAPDNTLLIYANPTNGKCNITIPEEFRHEETLTLYIYDNQGKLIQQASLSQATGENTYRLDIRAQAAGVYNAVLTNGTKSYTGRIIFEKRQ